MSFAVNFYSFKKAQNSTKRPADAPGVSYNCVLKDDCSTINPIIRLQTIITDSPNYNYAYIAEFERYYFVNDWVFSGRLWEAVCNVDVLATYKDTIAETSNYIVRASAESDEFICDSAYPARTEITRRLATITNHFIGGGCYVVGVQGNGLTNYYAMTIAQLDGLIEYLFSDDYVHQILPSDVIEQYPQYKVNLNPLQFITSITQYLFNVEVSTSPTQVIVGWGTTNIEAPRVRRVTTYIDDWILSSHPQAATRGAYLNSDPFTKYILCYPPFGTITLSATAIARVEQIQTRVVLDAVAGSATLSVVDFHSDTVFSVVHGSLGNQISISGAIAPGTGTGNIIEAGVTAFGQALTGNIGGALQTGIDSIKSSLANAIPSVSSAGGVSGGMDGAVGPCSMVTDHFLIVDEDLAGIGRPLMKVRTHGSLPGFQSSQNPDIQISGSKQEADQIISYLRNGFYYE